MKGHPLGEYTHNNILTGPAIGVGGTIYNLVTLKSTTFHHLGAYPLSEGHPCTPPNPRCKRNLIFLFHTLYLCYGRRRRRRRRRWVLVQRRCCFVGIRYGTPRLRPSRLRTTPRKGLCQYSIQLRLFIYRSSRPLRSLTPRFTPCSAVARTYVYVSVHHAVMFSENDPAFGVTVTFDDPVRTIRFDPLAFDDVGTRALTPIVDLFRERVRQR